MRSAVASYISIVGVHGFTSAVIGKLTGRSVLMKARKRDFQFPIHLRVPSSDVAAFEQIFIKKEYDFRARMSPKVIIDAGANIGLAAVYFAARFPDAMIVAIEPERSNYELLQLNVASYPNVIPVQAALWNEDKVIDVIDPGTGMWSFMTGDSQDRDKTLGSVCDSVQGMTIETIVNKYGIGAIDVLKMDIEGAEKEVFEVASPWIDRVGALIVELHDRKKPGCSRSFYNATNGFDEEWFQGENVFLARRDGCLARRI